MPRTTKHLESTKWKKGQSGNPLGAAKHDPAKRALKQLTLQTYREVIELVLTGNVAALKAMVEHPDTPAIQVGVATSFMKAIKSGDYGIIERIAERIVGEIPKVVKIDSVNNTNLSINPIELKLALEKLEQDV